MDNLAGPDYRDDEWWRDHYSGQILALWQAIIPPEQARDDADFIIAHCGLRPADRVLDVPCGEGRVAIELARRGLRMTGIDIAPGQIDIARHNAAAAGIDIDWHVADMRALPATAPYDAAICWGDSFGYMDDAGNRDFLRAVHRALKPGGRWAMEMQMVAEVVLPRLQTRVSGRAGEFTVAVQRSYDERLGRLAVEYQIERNGKRERRTASYRIHTSAEIRTLLEQAGFRVDALCAGDGSAFSAQSDRLRVVCTALGSGET